MTRANKRVMSLWGGLTHSWARLWTWLNNLGRRRWVGMLVPGLVGVLIGGFLGSILAGGDGSPTPRSSSISVAIPELISKQATSPETVPKTDTEKVSETVARAESIAEIGEAEEAVFARLYEEPMEPAVEPGQEATPDPVEPMAPGAAGMPLPAISAPESAATEPPAWERYAVPLIGAGRRPMIAVVLDDLGLNRPGAWRAIALPSPLTLSFMTYAEGLEHLADRARGAGHELLLHVPMEPSGAASNPGPNVLLTDMPADEVARRLDWALGRFEGFVGINNHMGSKFTSSLRAMATVMDELKARGLLFLDSRTASSSVGTALAAQLGVPHAERDIFLDNEWRDGTAIRRQLERLEARARRQGYAVGIGHPHRVTLEVLAEWLPEVRERGFDLVPVSAIVRHRMGWTQQFAGKPG